jgi:hypothetical protein
VLLVGAGLFTKSLLRVSALDMGFASKPVVGVGVRLSAIPDSAARGPIMVRVTDALSRVPGVQEVATSMSVPFRPSFVPRLLIPGRDDLPGVGNKGFGYPTLVPVSPEYFSVMSIPILRGRGFAASDNASRAPVMAIDATMAQAFWPNGDAIGHCLRVGSDTTPCIEIVGIVGNTHRSVTDERPMLRYFIPLDQATFGRRVVDRFLFARTSGDAEELIGTVRAAVAAASPSTPFGDVFAVTPWLDPDTERWQLGTTAFVAFGVLATVIATIGLYGVVSFGVAQRERELGIRRALGATTSTLLRGVVFGASARSLLGLTLGGVLSIALAKRLWELLFHPTLDDALVFGGVVAVVLIATIAASTGPAWRAMRADPMEALRAD